ncbi:MAG: acyl-CoA dehydrogenase family protein [Candidatus Binataceae bacterium]
MKVDRAEIPRRVAEVAPALERNARACDEARMLVPESMRIMRDAGLFRITVPERDGGYELPLRTLADAVTALSIACPSSGWVLMVMGAHHWCMGSFSEAAQAEVFAHGGDGLIAGTLSWQGTAASVGGGYRVDGRWQFGSGIDHAKWVMLGCADPETREPKIHVVIPRAEIEVDDTWRVLGLRGSGSKDLVAKGIFVPACRAINTRVLFGGTSPHARNHPTNLYKLSAEAMLSNSVATAVLGSAKFALEKFIERTRERRTILTGARKAEHAPTQIRLAEAAAEIHSAELLLADTQTLFERFMESGESMDFAARAKAKWNAAYSAELCRRAVARLYSGSGAHSVYESSPLQTAFRNINVGAQHASIDFDSSAEMYARVHLGVTK